MEHLNRRLKTVIRTMGANISASRIERAGRAIHQVHKVCEVFESQTARRLTSDKHPYPSFGKDFSTVFKCIIDEEVFKKKATGRRYPSFSFKNNLMKSVSRKELVKKVNTTLKRLQ